MFVLQEETKDEIRHRKRTTKPKKDSTASEPAPETEKTAKPKKKRVSFG